MSAVRQWRYTQLDVFTETALLGNPLAVVHGADGIDDARMQAFARWTNLSETTFLLAPTDPGADYRVRIFTPGSELPFAGHPTLGSCHAWLSAGGVPRTAGRVVQQSGVGLVTVRRDGARLAFAAPPTSVEAVEPAVLDTVCRALGVSPQSVQEAAFLSNGPRQLALRLDSAASVLALQPDHAALKSLPKVGVVGPRPAGDECDFEVRFFAASIGIAEDPVTGSLNANLARWLIPRGLAPRRYVAAQGQALGRAGRVHVEDDGESVWIGGGVVTLIDGALYE
jgi:PhzF family phenazine biosynthesis protein